MEASRPTYWRGLRGSGGRASPGSKLKDVFCRDSRFTHLGQAEAEAQKLREEEEWRKNLIKKREKEAAEQEAKDAEKEDALITPMN